MQELCGVMTSNYDCFNWKQFCSEKEFRVSMAQKLRFGTYLEASHFRPFGSKETTKCLTMLNGIYRRLNIGSRIDSSCMLKWHGTK